MIVPAPFATVVKLLRDRYRKVERVEPDSPVALILFENAAYLVNDERRQSTFADLVRFIGSSADEIDSASDHQLSDALSKGGPMLANRLAKIRTSAQLTRTGCGCCCGSVTRRSDRHTQRTIVRWCAGLTTR